MDWYELTDKWQKESRSCDRLDVLPRSWQRELAAVGRLEANVNNGGYLQFLINSGRESYVYATQALNKIGAHRMAEIIDRCQALIDDHFKSEGDPGKQQLESLLPNRCIGRDGEMLKKEGSELPEPVLNELYDLSYEFMDYPNNLPELGWRYYQRFVKDNDQ